MSLLVCVNTNWLMFKVDIIKCVQNYHASGFSGLPIFIDTLLFNGYCKVTDGNIAQNYLNNKVHDE